LFTNQTSQTTDLSQRKPGKTRHYPALDGLRGVAALAVVAYHISLYFQLAYVPSHAYLAVDFFFMLSGYVIAYAYDSRLAQNMTVRGFMLVRLVRLYPLAFLGILVGIISLLIATRMTAGLHIKAVLEAGLANLFLLPTTALLNIRPLAFPANSPIWSLAFEIWINFLYALLFRVLTRLVLTVILVVGGFLVVWAALAHDGLNIGFYFATLYFGGVRVLFPFVAGVLLRRALFDGRLRSHPTHAGHAAFLLLIIVLFGPTFDNGAYDAAAVVIAFPIILYLGTLSPVSIRLDRIWSWLGNLSYPLYVLHFPFVVVLSNLAHHRHFHGVKLYLAAIGTFGAVVALSVAVFYIYDVPARRFLTKSLVNARPRVAGRRWFNAGAD